MKKLSLLFIVFSTHFLTAQIYTSPANTTTIGTLLPNSPNTNVDVGIGTSDPQSKLQVENGDINSTGWSVITSSPVPLRRIGFYTTNTVNNVTGGIANYGLTYSNTYPTGSSSTPIGPGVITSGFFGLSYYTTNFERMRIDFRGYVGIGTTTPTSMLQVNGEITALTIKGPSDIRFKKSIKPLQNSLDKICKLNGYSYEWRKDEFPEYNFKTGNDIGLIAQEVENLFPELVFTDDNEMKSKSVDYTKLVPVLVESIKELKAEVEALRELKAEIEELRGLKAEIENLKKETTQIK
jgi:Chaperone of endosialidase